MCAIILAKFSRHYRGHFSILLRQRGSFGGTRLYGLTWPRFETHWFGDRAAEMISIAEMVSIN